MARFAMGAVLGTMSVWFSGRDSWYLKSWIKAHLKQMYFHCLHRMETAVRRRLCCRWFEAMQFFFPTCVFCFEYCVYTCFEYCVYGMKSVYYRDLRFHNSIIMICKFLEIICILQIFNALSFNNRVSFVIFKLCIYRLRTLWDKNYVTTFLVS